MAVRGALSMLTFSKITGQEKVRDVLLGAARRNHVSHALHFPGPEGSGNLSLALAFAAYVLCENPEEDDACGVCPSCVKMAGIQHPDLHFVFPVIKPDKNKSTELFMSEWRNMILGNPLLTYLEWMEEIAEPNKQGIISVDLAQEIIRKLNMKSFLGGYRIAIIWMPERMHAPASNKLLKLIEEPPEKTLIMLVGNSRDELLPTILSRLQTVQVQGVSADKIADVLVDKHGVPPDRAHSIALLSDGNLNYAMRLAHDDGDEAPYFTLFAEWFRACYQKSEAIKRTAVTDQFADLKREGQKAFFSYALQIIRQCMLVNNQRPELLQVEGPTKELVVKLAAVLNNQQMFRISAAIDEAAGHIQRNAHPKITFTDLSVQIKNLFHNA